MCEALKRGFFFQISNKQQSASSGSHLVTTSTASRQVRVQCGLNPPLRRVVVVRVEGPFMTFV